MIPITTEARRLRGPSHRQDRAGDQDTGRVPAQGMHRAAQGRVGGQDTVREVDMVLALALEPDREDLEVAPAWDREAGTDLEAGAALVWRRELEADRLRVQAVEADPADAPGADMALEVEADPAEDPEAGMVLEVKADRAEDRDTPERTARFAAVSYVFRVPSVLVPRLRRPNRSTHAPSSWNARQGSRFGLHGAGTRAATRGATAQCTPNPQCHERFRPRGLTVSARAS